MIGSTSVGLTDHIVWMMATVCANVGVSSLRLPRTVEHLPRRQRSVASRPVFRRRSFRANRRAALVHLGSALQGIGSSLRGLRSLYRGYARHPCRSRSSLERHPCRSTGPLGRHPCRSTGPLERHPCRAIERHPCRATKCHPVENSASPPPPLSSSPTSSRGARFGSSTPSRACVGAGPRRSNPPLPAGVRPAAPCAAEGPRARSVS